MQLLALADARLDGPDRREGESLQLPILAEQRDADGIVRDQARQLSGKGAVTPWLTTSIRIGRTIGGSNTPVEAATIVTSWTESPRPASTARLPGWSPSPSDLYRWRGPCGRRLL